MKKQNTGKNRTFGRIVIILIVIFLLSSSTLQMSHANTEEPPEEYRGETITSVGSEGSAVIQEESFGIAWGDPGGPHSKYDWPFTFVQMGHAIQSYQNYSSGTSQAYFHHGIDMIAPNGTEVYTRSGGKVVNVENYQPGNSLYWEVAILDEEGYVWQYHHIDKPTIPDLIYQKFAEWQADPVNGGYISPNTHIGNIIYWPQVSFTYRFNHIHLNILAAGDIYLNPMEFHTPIEDTQSPEIQAIGLLNGNTIVSGNMASGNYGMYVRARDLYKSTVYYLPPYKTEFSIDGGQWTTVWEFHDFPGGFNDEAYVNDFFVPVITKGDYYNRDFYIDLGFTTEGQRTFTNEPGEHTIEVRVWDYAGNSDLDSFTYNVVSSIPDNGCGSGNGITRTFQVTEDLMVTDVNLGINLSHASRGQVQVTLKSPTDTTATTIINSSDDTYDNYDLWVDDSSSNSLNDGGNDSVAAPYFDRTVGPSTNGTLDSFNGKATLGEWTVFICDNVGGTTGTVNLIDLEVSGVLSGNNPPVALDQFYNMEMNSSLWITLEGEDFENDPLTFEVLSEPIHGSLRGNPTNLLYTTPPDFSGVDSFTYRVNDGDLNSEAATVNITINPSGPITVFFDDFERDLGWIADPDGDDTAASGYFVRANPEDVEYNGGKTQLGTTVSGLYDLVTGPLAGYSAGTYDLDGGETTIRSREIFLPAGRELTLAFNYYLAHLNNSTSDDYLRVTVEGDISQQVFEELGANNNDYAVWERFSSDISRFAGQTVTLLIAAADAGEGSLLEAAIDDVLIEGERLNRTPLAGQQFITTSMDKPISFTLIASDDDEDTLSYAIVSEPKNGTLSESNSSSSGSNSILSDSSSSLIYTPNKDYYGYDFFEFVSQDGKAVSMPAVVTLWIGNPTSTNLLYFTAEESNSDIVVGWATSSEVDVLGFNLYRSTSVDGERTKHNSDLIHAGNPGEIKGQDYSFVDSDFDGGSDTLYYFLELVDLSEGSEFYGPVEIKPAFQENLVFPYKLYVPLIGK